MTERYHVYEAGTVIALATGEYSDFGYIGHVKALGELDVPALMQEYRDQYEPKDEWDEADPHGFLGWLISTGKVEAFDCQECHIGSYGRLEV